MKKIVAWFRNVFTKILDWFTNITWFRFSIVSLVIVLINFFPLITTLGFYLDEWPQLYSWSNYGLEGIKQYWSADSRGFAWWVEGFLFPIFGTRPLLWHIFLAILRWASSILVWLIFTRIWPKLRYPITIAALLFGIYPLFAQQSSGLMFSTIWVCFNLYLLSVWLMVLAVNSKKWFIPLLVAGVALDLVNLMTCEYFLGLELLRPFIILLAINRDSLTRSKIFFKSLIQSILWLVIPLGYLVWRAFLITTPTLRTPTVFVQLFSSPLTTIFNLFQTLIRDFIQIVISIWYTTFNPTLIDFQVPSELFSIALGALVVVIIGVFLVYYSKKEQGRIEESNAWIRQFLWFGALAVILGAAPAWAIGKNVNDSGIASDRYGIASMIGASLFLVGLVFSLFKPTRGRIGLFFALIMAFATGSNIRIANDYRWSAIYQARFYNQLVWRAPSIEPNTAILGANELFPKMGVYPTAYAINTLYPAVNPQPELNYWFFTIDKYFADQFEDLNKGMPITTKKWYTTFSSHSSDNLVIHWSYALSSCVWVLDTNDINNPYVSSSAKQILGTSDKSRITEKVTAGYPSTDIFGPELEHGWCYYFEKADLAKQMQDWQKIVELYQQTELEGLDSEMGPEFTPFIFGYAMTGDYDKAMQLTYKAKNLKEKMFEKMDPYLCDQWQAIYEMAPASGELDAAYKAEMEYLQCEVN